jgi:hypothetical protein
VLDVLKRATRAAKIPFEFAGVQAYNTAYIKGVYNIYEFDCGPLSGWLYKVNGLFPSYGLSSYTLKQGDAVEIVYTCDLGYDVGRDSLAEQGAP